ADRRSARRDGRRPRRRDSRRALLQLSDAAHEDLRIGDGRLLDGVSEYRGEELHVMPKIAHSPGAPTGRAGRNRRVATSLAEINVVPLVDVMLVLLIIFMV